ncbi:MAG TPA: sulfocyanin-like copper-binding protein [Streptosporangiaceae bacterium]
MTRTRASIAAAGALVLAAAVGTIVAVAATSSPRSPAGRGAAAGHAGNPAYQYYRSMMGRYLGSGMMSGASYRWMMSPAGYKWMTGGGAVPGWMHSTRLPGAMMGSGSMMGPGASGWARSMMGAGSDPGKIMGRLWANAPGPRVTPGKATQLGNQVPAGAQVNQAKDAITFAATTAHLVVVASPAGGPDETFRIAGMTNPAITVPVGSRISIEVVNADPDTAHGLVITSGSGRPSWMPMMTASPAFPGAALWFLGNPTTAGMHAGTLSFTATTAGIYHYLCPVPGHAQEGMIGTFVVNGTG